MKTIPESYREIRIEDIDKAILNWFDRIVDAHVSFPDGRRWKVPVNIGMNERWSAAKGGMPRDSAGRLILPMISVSRKDLDPTNGMLGLGSNVPRLQLSKKVSSKTDNAINAISLRSQSLLSAVPVRTVYEVSTIPFPFNGLAHYEVKIYAQYVGHVNTIIERIMYELEFFDVPSFVAPIKVDGLPEGTGPTEGELEESEHLPFEDRKLGEDYYVCGYFESSFSPNGNSDDFSEQERVLEYDSSFMVPVFLHLNPPDKHEAVTTEYTSFGIEFGKEKVIVPDNEDEIELILSGRPIVEKVRTR